MSPASGVPFFFHLLLLLCFTIFTSTQHQARFVHGAVMDNNETMVPLVVEPTAKVMIFNETRRRLGSFRICSLCTCCGGPKGLCLLSPCCYAINCNIPNRPFGYCSFTPKTCNCFGCHI